MSTIDYLINRWNNKRLVGNFGCANCNLSLYLYLLCVAPSKLQRTACVCICCEQLISKIIFVVCICICCDNAQLIRIYFSSVLFGQTVLVRWPVWLVPHANQEMFLNSSICIVLRSECKSPRHAWFNVPFHIVCLGSQTCIDKTTFYNTLLPHLLCQPKPWRAARLRR